METDKEECYLLCEKYKIFQKEKSKALRGTRRVYLSRNRSVRGN